MPYIYPTPKGRVLAEWSLQSNEASLEIDLEHHTAEWHLLDMDTDQGEMCDLNLDEDTTWDWVASEIGRLSANEWSAMPMNIQSIKEGLERTTGKSFDLYERRPGEHQLIIPIFHEDADMVDIYLQESPKDTRLIRICDYGLTLMRLSYTYDVNTDSKQRILDGILANNGVQNDNGNLYLDTTPEMLYQGVLQFAGCAQKVCNIRYLQDTSGV